MKVIAMPGQAGSIHLFQVAGIHVFLHWTWFLVALFEIGNRAAHYRSLAWNVLEYLALFMIVLLHEFGHALACRQVGGKANRIVLWPLGGIAYVDPPRRPGAMLWSISAGPLVNVALLVLVIALTMASGVAGSSLALPDLQKFLDALVIISLVLLVFNLLPIYPLDGGQILRSLLWFVMGPDRSLLAVTFVGFGGVALLAALALWTRNVWLGIMALFILLNCSQAWSRARLSLRLAKLSRREGYVCPSCGVKPPLGSQWICNNCKTRLDPFEMQSACPKCRLRFPAIRCLDCGTSHPMSAWSATELPPIPTSVVS
jgi:Zn-dependent protease